MKKSSRTILLVVPLLAAVTGVALAQQQPPPQQPPVAGKQIIGLAVEEMAMVTKGWSVKKQLIGKHVFNDKGDKIGAIEDVILSPDKTASFAIIGAGGFLGLDRHDVAIPFEQLSMTGNRITLPNATKDALKALPQFQYAK